MFKRLLFKRILAGIATAGLALGLIAVTAAPASAHHNTIEPSITCTDTFQYRVDWSVTNSESLVEEIVASSDTTLVPLETTLGDKETKVFTEFFSEPVSKTLTLTGTWSNNVTKEDQASIKKNGFPDCQPQHVPVTICHATPPDTAEVGWEEVTIDDDAIVTSGHNEQHDADIIPAFTYWAKVDGLWTTLEFLGKNLTTSFSGIPGSAILAAGCSYKATPAEPIFAPPQCTGAGTWGLGSYTIVATPGVRYEVRIGGSGNWSTVEAGTYFEPKGTVIDVRAIGNPFWVTLNAPKTWNYVVPSPGDCIITATPVQPAATPIEACDTYGSLIIPETAGVKYTLTEGDGKQGAWKVVATALPGYRLPGDQTEVIFTGNLRAFTECVTPEEPTFQASTCTGPGTQSGGSYTIPSTPGVTYQVKIDDGDWADAVADVYPVTAYPTTVAIRAVADPGKTISGYSDPEPFTFESAGECLEQVAPVAPVVTLITQCGEYGSVIPQSTEGVVYTLTTGDGKQGAWVITATPAAGYSFEGPQSVEFSGNLGTFTQCANTQAVVFIDSQCIPPADDTDALEPALVGTLEPGTFTIPSVTGVQFTVSINGSDFVDYVAGVYPVSAKDSVVVRAHALPTYTLVGQDEWSHTFPADPVCDTPTLGEVFPAASVAAQTCTAQGAITVKITDHVIYTIDGTVVTSATTPLAAGTYTVKATTDSPEWGIFGQDTWVLTVDPPTGACSALLAMTGGTLPIVGGALAGGLLFLGATFLLVRSRREA